MKGRVVVEGVLGSSHLEQRDQSHLHGDLPDSHPAAYVGLVTTTTMTMTVRLTDTNEVVGSFTLRRDTPGRVVKCVLPLVYG